MNNILTKTECIEIISKKLHSEDFKLVEYSIKPFSDTTNGYMANHLRLKCDIKTANQSQTLQFFIKMRMGDEECFQNLVTEESDVFATEPTILSFLCAENKNVFWLPEMLRFKSPNVIVFEDLSERNFEMGKLDCGGYDVPHCKCVLEALAQFHAFSLNYPRLDKIVQELNIFDDVFNNKSTKIGHKWLKAIEDSLSFLIQDSPFEFTTPKHVIIEKFLNYIKQFCDELQPQNSKFSVISHGDLWANNLMFKYQNDVPIQCCLVDFQVIRFIPLAQDILMFLYVNTSRKFRLEHMQELLDHYYMALANLYKFITKEEFDELCNKRRKSAFIIGAIYKTFMCMKRDDFTKLLTGKESAPEFIFGDRTKIIKELMERDSEFKENLHTELQDFIEIFQ